tara:strand:- start:66 stop:557 length:492 start_codon:yes stop_codon:yes gene_type:complete
MKKSLSKPIYTTKHKTNANTQQLDYFISSSTSFIKQLTTSSTIKNYEIYFSPLPSKPYTLNPDNTITPQLKSDVIYYSIKKITQNDINTIQEQNPLSKFLSITTKFITEKLQANEYKDSTYFHLVIGSTNTISGINILIQIDPKESLLKKQEIILSNLKETLN